MQLPHLCNGKVDRWYDGGNSAGIGCPSGYFRFIIQCLFFQRIDQGTVK